MFIASLILRKTGCIILALAKLQAIIFACDRSDFIFNLQSTTTNQTDTGKLPQTLRNFFFIDHQNPNQNE